MSENKPSGGLFRGTAVVASLTFVSRVLGFIRDLLVARLFGAGLFADCFFVAFRIPNLLRSFVAEGALTAAFVPVFSESLLKGRDQAQRTLSQVMGFLLLITLLLCVGGIVAAPLIISFMAPGFERHPESFDLCVQLTRIMLPYIIFISLVAMLNAALNAVQVFGAAAFSQVMMNLVLIGGAILASAFSELGAVRALSYSVVLGGLVQVAVQLPALRRGGFSFRAEFALRSAAIKQLRKLMLPAILGASIYQVSQLVSTLFASLLGTGSVSWLFYADRLTQLPIGIFSIALASVLLPTLANASAAADAENFSRSLDSSLRFTSFFIIPVAGILFLFAEPLISWMFERGKFGTEDTLNTAAAVRAYSVGLWSISCHSMVSRAFIARKDTLTPTIVGAATLLLNVFLALLFMGPLKPVAGSNLSLAVTMLQAPLLEVLPWWNLRHGGLALASSVSSIVSLLLMCLILSRRVGDLPWRSFVDSTLRAVIAVLAAFAVDQLLASYILPSKSYFAARLILFCVAYTLCAVVLKSREMRDCISVGAKLAKRSR